MKHILMFRNEAGLPRGRVGRAGVDGVARWKGPAGLEVIRWVLSYPARPSSSRAFPFTHSLDVGRSGRGRGHILPMPHVSSSSSGWLYNLCEPQFPCL